MPSYAPPKKNTEFIFYISLVSQADVKLFQTDPTLAAGDVKVSTDGGAEGNISTLPVVTPAGSKRVKVTLSISEMNGDNIQVTFSDVAGSEWCDLTVNIQTAATQIDNLVRSTTPANTLDIASTGEAGIDFDNIKGTHPIVTTVTNVTNDVGITQAAANKTWSSPTRILTSFGTLVADIWAAVTRTLTSGGGLTAQETRDSMKLAPTVGSPASGSIDEHLDNIQAKTNNLPETPKKNTAFTNPYQFFMEDASGNGVTGLTVTGIRVLDGIKTAIGAAITEVTSGGGWYQITPLAGDTNGDHVAHQFSTVTVGVKDSIVEFWTAT